MRRLIPLLLVAALLGGGALGGCGRSHAGAANLGPGQGVVVSVTDGDTLRVRLTDREEKVRLIGIDTPETNGRGGLRECFGREATKRMLALAPPGTRVRIVRDAELRDRYGRLLAYVYRARDGLFLNLAMARDGYADVLTYPPNVAHAEAFVEAVGQARDAERGLWKACGNADVPI